jgi:hypothetical protein
MVMLTITIIERRAGFRAIVEDRAARRAYVAPIFMDTYRDALKVAKEAARNMGGEAAARAAHIERIVRENHVPACFT